MNCRTARVPGQKGESPDAAYVTLGAGARATAGPYAREVTADSLAALISANAALDHPVRIGALGDLILAAGGQTKVIGNEDDVERKRAFVWVAANSEGAVSYALLDDIHGTRTAPLAPFGLDSRAWWGGVGVVSLEDLAPYPGLNVWVFGDVARADRYANLCTPETAASHRASALNRLTGLVEHEYGWGGPIGSDPGSPRVMILAAHAADSAGAGDRLAPILLWGPDIEAGLITSASTKTPGLVTNTDFLPTVATLLGLKTLPGMVGRPMTVTPVKMVRPGLWKRLMRLLGSDISPGGGALARPTAEIWAKMHADWYARSRQQAAFGGLPTLQALVVVLTLVLGVLGLRIALWHERMYRMAQALPLVPLWLPVLLLVLPVVAPESVVGAGFLLVGGLALPVLVGALRPGAVRTLAVLPLAALPVLLAGDLLLGTPLLKQAWMSYSVMEGARYYGIGNEYCGALLAAALGAVAFLSLPRWLAVALLGGLALLVGAPALGANAGGFLGLAIGFAAGTLVWWRGRLRGRDLLVILAIVALAMGALLAWDLMRASDAQTHIGRAMGGGPVQIALRKVQLNAWLLLNSPWAVALIAAAAALLAMWRRVESPIRQLVRDDRRFAGAFAGMLAGSLALLLLNDSGVVSAAESLLMTWAVATVAVRDQTVPQQAAS